MFPNSGYLGSFINENEIPHSETLSGTFLNRTWSFPGEAEGHRLILTHKQIVDTKYIAGTYLERFTCFDERTRSLGQRILASPRARNIGLPSKTAMSCLYLALVLQGRETEFSKSMEFIYTILQDLRKESGWRPWVKKGNRVYRTVKTNASRIRRSIGEADLQVMLKSMEV